MMTMRKEFNVIGCLATAVISISQLVGCNNGYELRHAAHQEKAQQESDIKAVYQSSQDAVLSLSESASGERYLNNQDVMQKQPSDEQTLQTSSLQAMQAQPKGQLIREYAAHYRVN